MTMVMDNEIVDINKLTHKIFFYSTQPDQNTIAIELLQNGENIEYLFARLINNEYTFQYPTFTDKQKTIIEYLVINKLAIVKKVEKVKNLTVLVKHYESKYSNITPRSHKIVLIERALLEAL